MRRPFHLGIVLLTSAGLLLSGCSPAHKFYLDEGDRLSHYVEVATRLEEPDVKVDRLAEVEFVHSPLEIADGKDIHFWDLSLEEAMQIGMANSKVLRVLRPGSTIQASPAPDILLGTLPDAINTIYNPAIEEANPIFGVEAALSAFDAQFSTQAFWERQDRLQNFSGPLTAFVPAVFVRDGASFNATISKTSATGATYSIEMNTFYDADNRTSLAVPSAWTQDVVATIRQPFLQGAGPTFNRIAGPTAQPGFFFSRGVLIARINTDIALTDFESGVRNFVSDLERAYWDLYFAYRDFEAQKSSRDAAQRLWAKVRANYPGTAAAHEEARARAQYYEFHSALIDRARNLLHAENRLRYMMGLAATDGRLIRPSDEPPQAEVHFDWHQAHCEALARTAELRKARWVVKQRELELVAAKNFLLPRLDGVARYRWMGLGDRLIDPDRNGDYLSGLEGTDAWSVLTGGDFQEWELGFELQVPIGFRRALSGVRHAQLRLARERAILKEKELEVSHLVTDAIREVDHLHQIMHSNLNRLVAAKKEYQSYFDLWESGVGELDPLLDAQLRQAQAQSNYYRTVADYGKSIARVHFVKGSLLEYNNVFLAEGPWPWKAYHDAVERARARTAGHHLNYGFSMPAVFSRGPIHQHGGTDVGLPPRGEPTPVEELPPPEPSRSPMDDESGPDRPATQTHWLPYSPTG